MSDCLRIERLIESYVDGDLAPDLRQQVADHTALCQECEKKLNLAIRIAGELHGLPKHTCPDTVLQDVYERIRPRRRKRLRYLIPSFRQLQPRYRVAFSIGLVMVLVTLITFSVYPPSHRFHEEQPTYSEQEIALAKENILLAFGYVNFATNRAQQMITEDVLPQRVVRPFQRSLDYIHLNKEKGESS